VKNRRTGSAFLLTLAVLAGLVAIVAGMATVRRERSKAEWNRMLELRAKLAADAGIQRAVAELQSLDKVKTLKTDSWYTIGEDGGMQFVVADDTFRLQVLDTGSQININTVDQPGLKALNLSDDQVQSLLDWRESTVTPARPEGAKDDYYNTLTQPYNTKLNNLASVDELLQVKGFNPSTLYGSVSALPGSPTLANLLCTDSVSADSDPNGDQKQDVNSATEAQLDSAGIPDGISQAIVYSEGSYTKMGDVLNVFGMTKDAAKDLLNYFTIGSTQDKAGLINVNTASEAVLSTIPGFTPDIVSAIIDRQKTGFVGLGDLMDVPGLEIPTISPVIDRFCTTSRSFTVRVMGTAGVARYAEEANLTVDDKGAVHITRVQPVTFRNPRQRWNWPEVTTDRVVVGVPW